MLLIASLLIFTFKTSIHFKYILPCQTKEWKDYKNKYNLEFFADEDAYRKEIFVKNCLFIMQSNSKNKNFTVKMNNFGHLVQLESIIHRKKMKCHCF
ncbi:hypothetical protein MXB_5128 [Myxobolus squamalis]|nr:hypothetical protein MXB_5128 [Myxobolus squamalis]